MGEVVSRRRLTELAAEARASGRSVALAAGDFDLFHVGQVRYLQASAREADLLLVAVEGDAVGRAVDRRYVLEAEHRAVLVAALRCVDYVTLLDGPLVHLLETVRPDAYCEDTVADDTAAVRKAVAAYGGRVVSLGDPSCPSRNDLLMRIAAGARLDDA